MFARRVRDPRTAHHPDQFLNALLPLEGGDTRYRSSVKSNFFDTVLMGRKGRDLRKMRHTKNLIAPRQLFQLLAYGFGCLAANSGIDLIKDKGLLRPVYSQHASQSKHQPSKLAPGSDAFQRPWFLRWIG